MSEAATDQLRPEWRTSSPRVLNALVLVILVGLGFLGLYHNHVLSVAKEAGEAAYEQWQRDQERERAPDPQEQAHARVLAVEREAIERRIRAQLKRQDCEGAAAAVVVAVREHPGHLPFKELEGLAQECRRSAARRELLERREQERRDALLVAAARLWRGGDAPGAIETLARGRREFEATAVIDEQRASYALDLARSQQNEAAFEDALRTVEVAFDAVRELPPGASSERLEGLAAAERAAIRDAIDAGAMARGAAAIDDHAVPLIAAGEVIRAVRFLWRLQEATGDGRAGDVAAGAVAEFLRSDLVEVVGGEVSVDGSGGSQSVHVDAFRIGRREVTRLEFALYLRASGAPAPPGWAGAGTDVLWPTQPDLPVTGLTLGEAEGFATWLGLRLPTEAEWQRAAQGIDARRYPWGDEPVSPARANVAPPAVGAREGRLVMVPSLEPAGIRPEGASPYGVLDMAGNAAEWTSSPWEPGSSLQVVRGGSFGFGAIAATVRHRIGYPVDARDATVGFRVAGSP